MSLLLPAHADESQPWAVPLAGNAFLTKTADGSQDGFGGNGQRWQQSTTVFSVYFHVDRPCDLELSLRANNDAPSVIQASVLSQKWKVAVDSKDYAEQQVGKFAVKALGYVRVDLQGLSKTGANFGNVSDVVVRTSTPGVIFSYVKSNEGNMFYWGKRGPSVHLNYKMPAAKEIRYAYNELTVPPGQDPIGSYFMANGFGEGYFGIQVKSPTERWILFSVWSPFQTDNPNAIPEDHKIVMLAKGDDVRVGAFGGEGSGGQSYAIFPWKAGTAYKFLNSAEPDGKGHTVYSAWYGEVGKPDWKLMASFQRPKTEKYLTGFHSFLENFDASRGNYVRSCLYANQWVCGVDGEWYEITEAHFTGDATAGGGHRLDYAGGVTGKGFFLRNCGFFSDRVKTNQSFTRKPTPTKKPVIDFSKLP